MNTLEQSVLAKLLTEFDVPRERVGPTITMGKVAFKFPPLLGGTEERGREVLLKIFW
jgi:hypothetical protein